MPDFKRRVQALRDAGKSPSDSWQIAAQEFGYGSVPEEQEAPKPVSPNAYTPTADPDEFAALLEHTEGEQTSIAADIAWAYANLENPSIAPSAAPSPGAWAWLQFGRSNRVKFLSDAVVRILSKKTDDGKREDDDPDMGMLDDWIAQYRREHPEAYEEAETLAAAMQDRTVVCPCCSTPFRLPAPRVISGEVTFPAPVAS